MKQPKVVLQWGDTSVLGKIIREFQTSGITDVIVVTGGYRELIEKEATSRGAYSIFNPDYENGEMLDSLKVGLKHVSQKDNDAVFVALGDQPGIDHTDISMMCDLFETTRGSLIIPSYNFRRGHPWLIARSLWNEIINLQSGKTMRDFIESKKDIIQYYVVQKSNILDDLDTPDDYQRMRPQDKEIDG